MNGTRVTRMNGMERNVDELLTLSCIAFCQAPPRTRLGNQTKAHIREKFPVYIS